jgi:gentisate 1,2-dioxygenase
MDFSSPDTTMHAKVDIQQQRREYYRRLETRAMKPLWEVLAILVPALPSTDALPALWRWADVEPFLRESGELISAQEAERRVLILENPGLAGQHTCTPTIYAGLQLILPGEVAPAHRHTQSALRFVVDGAGAYTAVNGERVTMQPGDFIITPKWTWHDHGNPGDQPVTWLDGLDISVVRLLGAQFRENLHEASQAVTRPEGDAAARFGANMLPLDYVPQDGVTPIFCYPYGQSRAALAQLLIHAGSHTGPGGLHPAHGVKMQYVNPSTGGSPIATIAAFLQMLPAGFAGVPYRSTDGMIYSVVEGEGRVELEDRSFDFGPKDTFVIPSWVRHRLHAGAQSVLFSFSDRPIHKALHLWREHVGD